MGVALERGYNLSHRDIDSVEEGAFSTWARRYHVFMSMFIVYVFLMSIVDVNYDATVDACISPTSLFSRCHFCRCQNVDVNVLCIIPFNGEFPLAVSGHFGSGHVIRGALDGYPSVRARCVFFVTENPAVRFGSVRS